MHLPTDGLTDGLVAEYELDVADCSLGSRLEAISTDPAASFKKHAAYFVFDYVQSFHSYSVQRIVPPSADGCGVQVGEEILRQLQPGVFAMLSVCEDEERKLVHNGSNAAGKTLFKQLDAEYNQDFKYKGGS